MCLPVLLIFGMITLVGVFNLVSTLVMIVVEKKRDIGILKSIGAHPRSIMKIFLFEGIIIGGIIEYSNVMAGTWIYPGGNVPIWFITFWASVGLLDNRLLRTSLTQ